MSEAAFYDTLRQGLWTATLLSMPILTIALVAGLAIGLLQALTSVQEQTLTFVPKLIVVGACLAIFGSAILMLLVDFTHELFARIPELTQ